MKKIIYFLAGVTIVYLIFVLSNDFFRVPNKNRISDEYIEYECDVKKFSFNTQIFIDKEEEEIAVVKGDIFKLIEDPLTMYDVNDKKIAYAGDTYHLMAQDSHGIYRDNKFICDMIGLVDFIGESYIIYDIDGYFIAGMEFNEVNTKGILFDYNDNLLAEYDSNIFNEDFNVKIYSNCNFDENTVLMLFCSYYSDYSVDK